MPANGLPDNAGLTRSLEQTRIEKTLSGQAGLLKHQLASIQEQMRTVKAMGKKERVNVYCDQLELEIREAIDSVVRNLSEIEQDLLKEVQTYRSECLDSGSAETEGHLDALSNEIRQFSSQWNNDFFSKIEAVATDAEIQSALSKAEEYETRIRAIDVKLRFSALNRKLRVFKPKPSLFDKKKLFERYDLSLKIETTKGKVIFDQCHSIFGLTPCCFSFKK